MVDDQGYSIKVAVQKTGLTPHVIRIWEKRYSAVTPSRTSTQRRRYTETEIQRLLLLRQATQAGYGIGQIAHLPTEKLRELSDTSLPVTTALPSTPVPALVVMPTSTSFDACRNAIERLDAVDLEATLMRARVMLSHVAFLDTLVVPLMRHIGDSWRDGTLRMVHEHLAYAVLRTLLGSLVITRSVPASAPHLVVSTPGGQFHELGALVAASIASTEGWGVTYLGPNLPAEEIAVAVQQHHARGVALSLTYPPDDLHLSQELTRLHRYLSPDVTIFMGGRAAEHYQEVLQSIGAIHPLHWSDFRSHLETIRTASVVPA